MQDRIDYHVAGRAKDYLNRAMEIVRAQHATPVLVGLPVMIAQARETVGAGADEITITDFSVAAIRERVSRDYPENTVFLLLPANYEQFIHINRFTDKIIGSGIQTLDGTGLIVGCN